MKKITLLVSCMLLTPTVTQAQHQSGRWTIGVHAEANMWLNDLNQRLVGLGGDVIARYGVDRGFSVGLEFGVERLKTGQNPTSTDYPFEYLRLNGVPISLMTWYHFLPGNAAAPYAFVGIGVLPFTRSNSLGSASSLRVPFGAGIETFIERGLSYDFNVGYVLLNDRTETISRGLTDGYVNVRFGMNFYLGTADDEDEDGDGLTTAQEIVLGTNPTNPDTDEDGIRDNNEKKYGTDPLNADTDGDGLKDGEENSKSCTDPLLADTDGDGFSDGDEVFKGSNPCDATSTPNATPQ
jgi:hypothetical protein